MTLTSNDTNEAYDTEIERELSARFAELKAEMPVPAPQWARVMAEAERARCGRYADFCRACRTTGNKCQP